MSNKILLDVVCGSKSFNLQTKHSDTDRVIVSNSPILYYRKHDDFGRDILNFMASPYLSYFYRPAKIDMVIQGFTPYKIITPTAASHFLADTSEDWPRANAPFIYSSYLSKAENIFALFDTEYGICTPKRHMFIARLLWTLSEYANTSNWLQAHRVSDEKRDFFLDIRLRRLSKEETYDRINNLLIKAKAAAPFYDRPIDKKFNDFFISEMCEKLDIDRVEMLSKFDFLSNFCYNI